MSMDKIALPAALTINACEAAISEVCSAGRGMSLILPKNPKYAFFGGFAAGAQVAMTWARNSSDRKLYLKHETDAAALESLMEYPQNFIAGLMSSSIYGVDGVDDKIDLFYSEASKKLDEQAASETGSHRGGLSYFIFADSSSKGYDKNFYFGPGGAEKNVRDVKSIKNVVGRMLERAYKFTAAEELDEESMEAITRIVYELFLNTHQHGRWSERREIRVKPSVRAVFVGAVNVLDRAATEAVHSMPPLSRYIDGLGLGQRARFIEISVLDSGVGYFRRWAADKGEEALHNDVSSQYEIFKKCMKFRMSSSGSNVKGNGLFAVMDRLTQLKGFMRVRTGRLSLYRDFNYAPTKDVSDIDFKDWLGAPDVSLHPECAGSLISILIPLGEKK